MNNLEEKLLQLTNDMNHLRQDVDELTKTVLIGNGSPSLVSQAADLNGRFQNLELIINEKFHFTNREITLKFENLTSTINREMTAINAIVNHHFEEGQTDRAGKWELRTALVTSGIAIVIAVVVFVLDKI
jgi:hypothetical protein